MSLLPWAWLLAALALLVVLERQLHHSLQQLMLALLRNRERAMWAYALILLPGVFVHEASHWLMATLLGVRAARFSIWPKRQRNGMLRLGYVETEAVDFVRESLIGAAPLLAGLALIAFTARRTLALDGVGQAMMAGNWVAALDRLGDMPALPNFWFWAYLLFAVSNAMLPSGSDRRAWPWAGLALLLVGAAIAYAGFGGLVIDRLAEPVQSMVGALAGAFSVAVLMNLLILPAVVLAERALMLLTRRAGG